MWDKFLLVLGKGGTAMATTLAPFFKPIADLLKKAVAKSYILLVAWMARREGEEDARAKSVEETLKNVDKVKKARNSQKLRDAVADKYDRDRL
jgi:hypothetical protein